MQRFWRRLVYYLFFASNNSLSHFKMKEAMWKVDPMGDFGFSDSTNPDQALLFNDPLDRLPCSLYRNESAELSLSGHVFSIRAGQRPTVSKPLQV